MLSRYRYVKRAMDVVGAVVGLVLRSMYTSAPKECAANDLQDRVHMVKRVEIFLRKSSLDEVPQLWNVLKGDMSLIGPRPLILSETWINEERAKCGVYELQPGITGLAQICGRNQVSDRDKVYFDEYYLTHYGVGVVLKILFCTVLYVILSRDII